MQNILNNFLNKTFPKILIFIYLIGILIFVSISFFFLYLKSSFFKDKIDIILTNIFSANSLIINHDTLEGDLLSSINIYNLSIRPDIDEFIKSFESKYDWNFYSNKVILTINPLSNILNYFTLKNIPLELNFYKNTIAFNNHTFEIDIAKNIFSIDFKLKKPKEALIKFNTSLNLVTNNFYNHLFTLPIILNGKLSIKKRIENLECLFTIFNANACIHNFFNLPKTNSKLLLDNVNVSLNILFNRFENLLKLTNSKISFNNNLVQIKDLIYLPLNNHYLKTQINISSFNTIELFKTFPIIKFLILSENVKLELDFEGNLNNFKNSNCNIKFLSLNSKLLEYDVNSEKYFTYIDAGDFINSLGLTSNYLYDAGTIEIDINQSSNEIILGNLKINSLNYNFNAQINLEKSNNLKGNFTLLIFPNILKYNTLNADFSEFKNGVNVYGQIFGTINNPIIIYDIDKQALLKISEGMLYKKIKDILK